MFTMKSSVLGACLLFGASMAQAKPVKNVILMIGDGMGAPQVTFGIVYARQSPDSPLKETGLQMERLMRSGQTGFMLTYPQGNLVVDSAASATQLATGYFAGSEMIGLDAEGNRRPTVLEKAKKSGRATGVVSSARLTHATPAAFIAHVPHRSMETLIAEQVLVSAPDVMLSAGFDYFLPKSVEDAKAPAAIAWRPRIPASMTLKSSRGDERDLLSEAEKAGYQLAFDFQSMQAMKKGKVLGLFGPSGMPTGIAEAGYENDPKRQYPTLKDMTEKALEVLSKDPDGFFLMVEGGQIDWAGHANDAGWMLNEILQFDKAVGAVFAFAQKHQDTLVIVTADHETGSFGFSYSKNDVPAPRQLSGDAFRDTLFAPKYNFGDPEVLRKLRQQSRPIEAIQEDFQALKPEDRKPDALVGLVKDATGFVLTAEEAAEILAAANAKGKPTTNSVIMEEFKQTFASNVPGNLIGHALAKEQQVVWGTGTHTMSMVPVMVFGPEQHQKRFRGLMHSTDVNHAMQKAMGFDVKKP
jgi:alkaline phosphatase